MHPSYTREVVGSSPTVPTIYLIEENMNRRMIVAMTRDGVIAKDGKIPWYYPSDIQRFRRLTIGSTVIMGHNTFESLPIKPLKDRRNIVVSNQIYLNSPNWSVRYLLDAITLCERNNWSYWIIGGGKIYEEAIPYVDYLDITIVPKEYSQSLGKLTYFPKLSKFPVNVRIKRTILDAESKYQYGAYEHPSGVDVSIND